mgnify:CR=1 FL=1
MRDDHGFAAGEAEAAQVKPTPRKWPRVLAGVVAWTLLLAGALMLLAPDILEMSYRVSADDRMAAVDKAADQAAASSAASDQLASPDDQETAEAVRRAADSLPWLQRYNEQVRSGMGAAVGDPFGLDASEGSLSSAGLSDTPVGRICVPAMDCDLPLYLGASQEHLALGAGVVSGTSAPIGEVDSNCVIAGHRGYSNVLFFREIENIKVGDPIVLSTIWGTFGYRAVSFEVISPSDVEAVSVQPGRDLVTLSTCHPYPYNTYRYLVVCERDQSAVSDIPSKSDGGLLPTIRSLDMAGGPIASDGGLDALFVENCGRITGRVLLVLLVAWPLGKLVARVVRSKKAV